ncbi:mitotic-spindle organizing protein 1-like [Coccinella septempunctata]|uniref:mitotic-spindle organizing protein 1-like n=1 Tax=Coccinella septempunctata TaxID=41139 RepID=UPI001D0861F3|nr:mitotic-spindle organizing protein 1-like [Coccinella septempunctata]
MKMSNTKLTQIKEAKETFQALMELSRLLGTGLDIETLSICVRLCEAGVNPEILATVIRELKKEAKSKSDENTSTSA